MRILLISILTALAISCFSTTIFQLPEKNDIIFIPDSSIESFVDETGTLTFENIKNTKDFKQGTSLLNQENWTAQKAFWIHLKLNKATKDWVFILGDPYTGKTDYYNVLEDTILHQQSGLERNFSTRELGFNNQVFKIDFGNQTSIDIYLRLQSKHPFGSTFLLWQENLAINGTLDSYLYKGILYGVLILLLFYSIFSYFLLKENLYIYYGFYLVSALLFISKDHFTAFQYLWPNHPEFNLWIQYFDHPLLMLSFLLFSSRFLNISFKSLLFKFLLSLWSIYVGILLIEHINKSEIHIDRGLELIIYGLFFFSAWKNSSLKNHYYRLYLIALSIWFIGYFIFISMSYGWFRIPNSAFAFNISLLIESLLLTIALLDRFRILKNNTIELKNENISILKEKEKLHEKVNTELENKVKERTNDLSLANEQLNEANSKLAAQAVEINQYNLSLDKDNYRLKKEFKSAIKQKLFTIELSFNDFKNVYPEEIDCLLLIRNIKWPSENFECKKCKHKTYSEGLKKHSRKCHRCGYDETVTSSTLFHNLKFPLSKALFIVFKTMDNNSSTPINKLAEEIDLRVATYSSFRKKVLLQLDTLPKNLSDNEKFNSLILLKE